MCGRFSISKTDGEILDELDSPAWPDRDYFTPAYNVPPSLVTPVLRGAGTDEVRSRHIRLMRWGLIPMWARDMKIGNNLSNARGETLTEKPSFSHLVRRRRCAVLSDGYYEWKREKGTKTPYYIRRADGDLLCMAGLWDTWILGEGQMIHSYTVITTDPADSIKHIHNRMPVILDPDTREAWINVNKTRKSEALRLIRPYAGDLEFYPVSTLVNSPKNNDPSCIEPSKPESEADPDLDLPGLFD